MADGEEKAFDLPVGKHSVYVKNIIPSNTLEFDLQENTEIKLVFSSPDSDRSQRRAIWIALFVTVLVTQLPGHFILFILISVIVYLLYMGIAKRFLIPLNLRLEPSHE